MLMIGQRLGSNAANAAIISEPIHGCDTTAVLRDAQWRKHEQEGFLGLRFRLCADLMTISVDQSPVQHVGSCGQIVIGACSRSRCNSIRPKHHIS
jgi:uncharacterized protein YfdQ (DUF2303 family)